VFGTQSAVKYGLVTVQIVTALLMSVSLRLWKSHYVKHGAGGSADR
jgi:hypothetical protein